MSCGQEPCPHFWHLCSNQESIQFEKSFLAAGILKIKGILKLPSLGD